MRRDIDQRLRKLEARHTTTHAQRTVRISELLQAAKERGHIDLGLAARATRVCEILNLARERMRSHSLTK
jgi:hypothetical protein